MNHEIDKKRNTGRTARLCLRAIKSLLAGGTVQVYTLARDTLASVRGYTKRSTIGISRRSNAPSTLTGRFTVAGINTSLELFACVRSPGSLPRSHSATSPPPASLVTPSI